MSLGKVVTLSSGSSVPQIGLGTWQSKPHEVGDAVEAAIRAGYRHIDLAMIYENQDEIGEALRKVVPSVVKREDLWITSKVWNSSHQPQEVERELDETLRQLGVEYLDLYLIHWPVAFKPGRGFYPLDASKPGHVDLDLETSLADTWKAMIALPKTKVRNIGVSNFTVAHLEGIIGATGVVPAVNQVEAHPLLPQDDLVAYCAAKGIHITAYSPLGGNTAGEKMLIEEPVVEEVAKRLGATPVQVLVAWGARRGYTVIPKSVKAERIVSNFQQIELGEEDYERITALGRGRHKRYNIPFRYKPTWDIALFGEDIEQGATHAVKVV